MLLFFDKNLLIAQRGATRVSAEQSRTRQQTAKWQKRSTSLDRNQEEFCKKKKKKLDAASLGQKMFAKKTLVRT